jgi:S1/P1 Nuclease
MWDGLLGKSTTASAIGRVVNQVNTLIQANPDLIKKDLQNNKTIESWARESFEAAKEYAYLNGELPLGEEDDDASDIAVAPDDYAKNSGRVARIQIAKAGARLATMLANVLE